MRHRVREWASLNSGVNGSVTIAAASAKLSGSPQWHDSQAHDDEIAVLGPVTSSALRALNSRSERSDHKNVRDSKDVKDFSKEIPGEGPGKEQPPAEPAARRPSSLSPESRRLFSNEIWTVA